eukprot:CAMPEP_0183336440 /NCGR_PEP_ID=MMETSP0164_2-20130417/4417_1 /TAXON_ID=221442 /ORGANISM="Coccolithus pelagicus ssp braarudi, Strain PLY182g" /LENGTH=233 /DNA_ID=CAMNT_0025505957 /DNA_START=333 /DNA_END=1035 /DNA_ORIENTATION=-
MSLPCQPHSALAGDGDEGLQHRVHNPTGTATLERDMHTCLIAEPADGSDVALRADDVPQASLYRPSDTHVVKVELVLHMPEPAHTLHWDATSNRRCFLILAGQRRQIHLCVHELHLPLWQHTAAAEPALHRECVYAVGIEQRLVVAFALAVSCASNVDRSGAGQNSAERHTQALQRLARATRITRLLNLSRRRLTLPYEVRRTDTNDFASRLTACGPPLDIAMPAKQHYLEAV